MVDLLKLQQVLTDVEFFTTRRTGRFPERRDVVRVLGRGQAVSDWCSTLVCSSGANATCMHLAACCGMPLYSVNASTTPADRTASAAGEASGPAAGDRDPTCPCPEAPPTPVRPPHTHSYIDPHQVTHNSIPTFCFPGEAAGSAVGKQNSSPVSSPVCSTVSVASFFPHVV